VCVCFHRVGGEGACVCVCVGIVQDCFGARGSGGFLPGLFRVGVTCELCVTWFVWRVCDMVCVLASPGGQHWH
jgi:hypothetical protein